MALSKMMSHYLQTKESYKDCILFYRLGDFYEMFFEDAEVASKVLDLTLTGKDCGLETRAPMCGVPFHSVEPYVAKLLTAGFKVAMCEQLSEPKKNEIVKRDVVRVITPGTVYEDSLLDAKKNNYIASICFNMGVYGIAYADISTGDFFTLELEGENAFKELSDFIVRLVPSEIITNENTLELIMDTPAYKMNVIRKPFVYYESSFNPNKAENSLKEQFGQSCIQVFELSKKTSSICASGALIEYLNETQKKSLEHISTIKNIHNEDYMIIDINTRRNLELTETIRDRKKVGSLLWLLDKTNSAMGARMFREWIDQPLKNEKQINLRLGGVEEIVKNSQMRLNFIEYLSKIRDIERICGKIAMGNLIPRDCLNLGVSLKVVPQLKQILNSCQSEKLVSLRDKIADFTQVQMAIENCICENLPANTKEGGYIKEGFSLELDDLRQAKTLGMTWIAALEEKERNETGIKNLKVSYNRVFGYFIEVNKSQQNLVPLRYVRKQTVANNERYITEELKEIEEKVLGADEKAIKLESEIFAQLRDALKKIVSDLQLLSKIIAELDCLTSLATCAVTYNYVKPKVSSRIKNINIVEGRHPVVERMIGDGQFIPNDTYLDEDKDKIMIITGPNMAGKSTYMRQVAVLTFMAHIGSFVPAKSAEFSLTDRIFTRVGASDDLAFGQSTFMVEMSEVAQILANATSKSLIILDEIGRGTSTFDGLSIAWAVVESLSKDYCAKTLFATHYHELTELEGMLDGVKNYRISVKEYNGSVIFLRKIVRGGANKSFGVEVASIAGVPKHIIDRAKEISKNLESADLNNKISLNAINEVQKQRKDNSNKVANQMYNIVKDINIERLTPLDAFDKLCSLVAMTKGENNE